MEKDKIMMKLAIQNAALKMENKRLRQDLFDVKSIIHNALFDYASSDAAYKALLKVRDQINNIGAFGMPEVIYCDTDSIKIKEDHKP